MSRQTAKGELVRNYITRFPNTPNLTLAKKIYAENNVMFKDVEEARSMVRMKKGQSGEFHRQEVKDKSQFAKPGKLNPFQLPESYGEVRKPFVLPLSCNNILVISDLHVPYHDTKAITAAMQYGIDNKVNCIVILGDLLDFHTISRFEKLPHKRSIAQEFDAARAILKALRDNFPNASIYFLRGNHDERYEKWLYVKAPEVFDVPDFQLDILLRLNEFKVNMIEGTPLMKAGKLNLTHGHHLIRGVFAPVNSARGGYIRAKASILFAHTHQVSTHTEKDIEGKMISCWSIGCCCTTSPDYDPLNTKHSTGFAHVTIDKNRDYHVKNMMVIDGKIF